MSGLKKSSHSALYRTARAVLIALASLYTLAVVLVMTPFIQTQYAHSLQLFKQI